MATLLRVPEVATGSSEAVLSEWLVPLDAAFAAGAPLALLETDKAAVEIEAEAGAVLLRRLVEGGARVEVGTPIAVLGQPGEDVSAVMAELTAPDGGSLAGPDPAGRDLTAPDPAAPKEAEPTPEPREAEPAPQPTVRPVSERVFTSPLARKLLREAGIAPAQVTGTGPNGRIVRKDVRAAIEKAAIDDGARAKALPTGAAEALERNAAEPEPEPLPIEVETRPEYRGSASAGAGFVEVPHSRIRLAIANRLIASKQTIPHFYVRRTARIDALLDLRKQLNDVSAPKISVNDLIIKAVAVAHQRVPEANVTWTEHSMRRYESVDVGVAIASGRGLVTPVLRAVEAASPSAIARRVKAFARQADEGRLMQRDLEGGSITVSNLGMYGVDEFAAIINPPQSAILAVGAGRPGPAVVDGALTVQTQLALVLSVDHRAVDGALAAQWMSALVDAIEQPLSLVA